MRDAQESETKTAPNGVAGRYWHMADDGRMVCDLCPRHCRLKDGQRGACFVRERIGEQMILTTYGRSSGYCIDAIEKKPLNHFLPGTPVLSFGTAGCNLSCKFCQNWDISKSREMDTLADQAGPDMIARAARQTGCRSVAFTYNDPVIFLEYAADVARACRAGDIKTVGVTAAYVTEQARGEFFGLMDAVNVDLKGFTDRFYERLCTAKLATVLDNLKYIVDETNTWLEITTLLIPGENDSAGEIEQMTQWIADNLGVDVPLHFTAFHPDYRMTDKERTPAATLIQARRIALEAGIRYVYIGNVHDKGRQSTYCHHCGNRLIGRDWYELSQWRLSPDGHCLSCGTRCKGVFDGLPGTWGRRRQPLKISGYA
ncbi:MAG: AmmeMemoRadiSam system radical SAM enzyme [Chromatiales bacterium]|nr:AmmeMemoRadiSam system radical SAM enzyme [Chromatiales bacterium]